MGRREQNFAKDAEAAGRTKPAPSRITASKIALERIRTTNPARSHNEIPKNIYARQALAGRVETRERQSPDWRIA